MQINFEENVIEFHIYFDAFPANPNNDKNVCFVDTNKTTIEVQDILGQGQPIDISITGYLLAMRASINAYLAPLLAVHPWHAGTLNLHVWNPFAYYSHLVAKKHGRRQHHDLSDVLLSSSSSVSQNSVHQGKMANTTPEQTDRLRKLLKDHYPMFNHLLKDDDDVSSIDRDGDGDGDGDDGSRPIDAHDLASNTGSNTTNNTDNMMDAIDNTMEDHPQPPPTPINDIDTSVLEEPLDFPNIPHIYGKLHYHQCIEDFYLVYYILLTLTSRFNDLTIQILEQDGGNMLLVDFLEQLPSFLHRPESAKNRIWLRQGQLLIVPRGLYRHESYVSQYYKLSEQYDHITPHLHTQSDSHNAPQASQHLQQRKHDWFWHHYIPKSIPPQLGLYYASFYTPLCIPSRFHSRLLTHRIRLYPHMLTTAAITIPMLVPLSIAYILTSSYSSILLSQCYNLYITTMTKMHPTTKFLQQVRQFSKFIFSQSIYGGQPFHRPSSLSSSLQSNTRCRPEQMPFVLLPVALPQTVIAQLLALQDDPSPFYKSLISMDVFRLIESQPNASKTDNKSPSSTPSPHPLAQVTSRDDTQLKASSILTTNDITSNALVLGYRVTLLFEFVYQLAVDKCHDLHVRYNPDRNTVSILSNPSSPFRHSQQKQPQPQQQQQQKHPQQQQDTPSLIPTTTTNALPMSANLLSETLGNAQLLLLRELVRQRLYMRPLHPTTCLDSDILLTDADDVTRLSSLLEQPPQDSCHGQDSKGANSGAASHPGQTFTMNSQQQQQQQPSGQTIKYIPLSDEPISFFAINPLPCLGVDVDVDEQMDRDINKDSHGNGNRNDHSHSSYHQEYNQLNQQYYPTYLQQPLRDIDQPLPTSDLINLAVVGDPSLKSITTLGTYRATLNDVPHIDLKEIELYRDQLVQSSATSNYTTTRPTFRARFPSIPLSLLYQSEKWATAFLNPHSDDPNYTVNMERIFDSEVEFDLLQHHQHDHDNTPSGSTPASSLGAATNALEPIPRVMREHTLLQSYRWDPLSVATIIDELTVAFPCSISITVPHTSGKVTIDACNINNRGFYSSHFTPLPPLPVSHAYSGAEPTASSSPFSSQTNADSSHTGNTTAPKPTTQKKPLFGKLLANPITTTSNQRSNPSTTTPTLTTTTHQPVRPAELASNTGIPFFYIHPYQLLPHFYNMERLRGLSWFGFYTAESQQHTIGFFLNATADAATTQQQQHSGGVSAQDTPSSSHDSSHAKVRVFLQQFLKQFELPLEDVLNSIQHKAAAQHRANIQHNGATSKDKVRPLLHAITKYNTITAPDSMGGTTDEENSIQQLPDVSNLHLSTFCILLLLHCIDLTHERSRSPFRSGASGGSGTGGTGGGAVYCQLSLPDHFLFLRQSEAPRGRRSTSRLSSDASTTATAASAFLESCRIPHDVIEYLCAYTAHGDINHDEIMNYHHYMGTTQDARDALVWTKEFKLRWLQQNRPELYSQLSVVPAHAEPMSDELMNDDQQMGERDTSDNTLMALDDQRDITSSSQKRIPYLQQFHDPVASIDDLRQEISEIDELMLSLDLQPTPQPFSSLTEQQQQQDLGGHHINHNRFHPPSPTAFAQRSTHSSKPAVNGHMSGALFWKDINQDYSGLIDPDAASTRGVNANTTTTNSTAGKHQHHHQQHQSVEQWLTDITDADLYNIDQGIPVKSATKKKKRNHHYMSILGSMDHESSDDDDDESEQSTDSDDDMIYDNIDPNEPPERTAERLVGRMLSRLQKDLIKDEAFDDSASDISDDDGDSQDYLSESDGGDTEYSYGKYDLPMKRKTTLDSGQSTQRASGYQSRKITIMDSDDDELESIDINHDSQSSSDSYRYTPSNSKKPPQIPSTTGGKRVKFVESEGDHVYHIPARGSSAHHHHQQQQQQQQQQQPPAGSIVIPMADLTNDTVSLEQYNIDPIAQFLSSTSTPVYRAHKPPAKEGKYHDGDHSDAGNDYSDGEHDHDHHSDDMYEDGNDDYDVLSSSASSTSSDEDIDDHDADIDLTFVGSLPTKTADNSGSKRPRASTSHSKKSQYHSLVRDMEAELSMLGSTHSQGDQSTPGSGMDAHALQSLLRALSAGEARDSLAQVLGLPQQQLSHLFDKLEIDVIDGDDTDQDDSRVLPPHRDTESHQ